YVVSSGRNEVVSFNLSSQTLADVASIGNGARHIALTGDSPNRVVVTNDFSNSVTIINLATLTTTTLNAPNGADPIVVNPVQHLAFIGQTAQSGVLVLDLSRNQFIGSVPTGDIAGGISYYPATFNVVATRSNLSSIAKFPYSRGIVSAAFPAEFTPRGLGVLPSGNSAIVANQDSNSVSLLNLQTQIVSARQSVGNSPVAVGIDGKRSVAYVVNSGDNTISLLDAGTLSPLGKLVVGSKPVAIGIDTGLDIGVVANRSSGSLTFINLATQSILSTLNVPDPLDIAIDSLVHRAFIASPGTKAVYVIDLATQTLYNTVTTLGTPAGIDVMPASSAFLVTDASNNRLVSYQYGIASEAGAIPLTSMPFRVRVNPITFEGVITSADPTANFVMEFNVNTNLTFTPITTVTVGADSEDTAIDTTNNRAIISSRTLNTVSVLQLP
ncbi:MAG: YncE family protein, partial [Candidatus Eremiobacteraeota bacterium]|nr:YncE family protein [Candidatus Eremiobacteraeota bacterium]